MKSKLELAAEEYSKSQPPKAVCVLPIEHSKAFLAGAKHREAEIKKLKEQIKDYEQALKFYGQEMNYSVDDYHGISGEMRNRCVLYSDCEERNEVYSYAGMRAREVLKKWGKNDTN